MNDLPPTIPKKVSVMCWIVMSCGMPSSVIWRGRLVRMLSRPKSLPAPLPVRRYTGDSMSVELASPARLVTWIPTRAGSPFWGSRL